MSEKEKTKFKCLSLVGKKCGMTRLFTNDGRADAVTLVEVEANRIVGIKTVEKDGYSAVQITLGTKKQSKLLKPEAGVYSKAGVKAGVGIWEFRVESSDDLAVGDEYGSGIFEIGAQVDVSGKSKGKGFQGVVKRWNFKMQDATHGNSLSHRAPGSIGQCQTPGRVFKGKKMAGHMGSRNVTVQSLEIIKINLEKNLLFVKGAVPGSNGSYIVIKPAVKFINAA